MQSIRSLGLLACAWLLAGVPAGASHLVTGNGLGFAVVSPEKATVTRLYAHPYSFVRPDKQNPLGEGVETANFIKELRWTGDGGQEPEAQPATADYEGDSQVIVAHGQNGKGHFYMPFGLRQTALVLDWESGSNGAAKGKWRVEWSHPVLSQRAVRRLGIDLFVLKFEGIEESLLMIPLSARRTKQDDPQQLLSTASAWALISVESDNEVDSTANDFDHWRMGLSALALAKREIEEMERWRVKPTVDFAGEQERHLWRQSEVMLRMGQSREPNRPGRYGNGLIVACLPDGVYFTPWVRDMAYATVALAHMGHQSEARAALLAYFNARPTGKMRAQTANADYQVSVVRYFGDGAEEPFFTQEGATNIEFDDWGLVLWALGEYLHTYDDPSLLKTPTYRGLLYESARDYVAKTLLKNLEAVGSKEEDGLIVAADTSIWEEHQKDKKHFAFSTSMAIVGLTRFAEVAGRSGDESTREEMLKEAGLLEKGFKAAFIRSGKLHGTMEEGVKNDIDGALLAIINFGVVADSQIVNDTVARMELLKVDSGGYRRVRGTYTDPAIFEYWYEQEEFLFVDFSLAEVNRRLGKNTKAAEILNRIVQKAAADHNIIPEMYVAVPCRLFPGALGDPTGALPMVGYGAGEFILHVIERKLIPKAS